MRPTAIRRTACATALGGVICIGALTTSGQAAGPNVLLVGTYNGVTGQYSTIQSAVNAAHPGDWILIGPGDYHERADYANNSWPAGVWIQKQGIHLRGMNRNTVIVDGTKPGSPGHCSASPSAQDDGPNNQGRNGIEVFGKSRAADGVSVDNLTVCNFLTSKGGGNGNEVWWNGGDGGGAIGLYGYEGSYLTATSTYSNTTTSLGGACCGVNYPAGSYGIFSSDATRSTSGGFSSWTNDYASNMADSSYYIGACQQRCDVVMNNDRGEYSSLCISTTNAGGYLLIEHTTCDLNKTGPVSNSQNNDDWPSPQIGLCNTSLKTEPQKGATGTPSCTVWQFNTLVNNNNPNVPGNGTSGLAGGGPVGTGLILAGTQDITLYKNDIESNKSWGALVVDLPDQETGPANCRGGLLVSPPQQTPVCVWPAIGNVSIGNKFLNNGAGYGVPNGSLGDIGLATVAHASPPFSSTNGNCYSGDTDSGRTGGPYTDPPGVETAPAYQPNSQGLCTQPNAGDYGPLAAEAECASQLLAPCPTLESLCKFSSLPCVPAPTPIDYPRPASSFKLLMPPAQTSMPNPCGGVPVNGFCPRAVTALSSVPALAAGSIAGLALLVAAGRRLRERRAVRPSA